MSGLNRLYTAATVALLLGAAAPGSASDGVAEINQERALAGGVTASDTPGFPVTIDTGGSYLLTGSLTVSDPNSDGIEILEDNGVSLDLNGFEIVGPVTCSGDPLSCDPGSGIGIDAQGRTRVTVREGWVRGFAQYGVQVGDRGHLRNLGVESNGAHGIVAGAQASVVECIAYQNGGAGISVGSESVVQWSVAASNGADGINTDSANAIVGNVSSSNGSRGISSNGVASVIRENRVVGNGSHGIEGTEIVVRNNSVRENGQEGIRSSGAGTVIGNAVSLSTSWGLNGGTASAYGLNVFYLNNDPNPDVTGGLQTGQNLCDGALCPP
jgi:hypothetical protein